MESIIFQGSKPEHSHKGFVLCSLWKEVSPVKVCIQVASPRDELTGKKVGERQTSQRMEGGKQLGSHGWDCTNQTGTGENYQAFQRVK